MNRETSKEVVVLAALFRNGVYSPSGYFPGLSGIYEHHFMTKTRGKTIVMGRKTWLSLPRPEILTASRDVIVLSRSPRFVCEGATVAQSLDEAVSIAFHDKVFIVGGMSLWYEAMEFADQAIVTLIIKDIEDKTDQLKAERLVTVPQYWKRFRFQDAVPTRDYIDGAFIDVRFLYWKAS